MLFSSQRGTVTLAPAWERGWGVLVGNKPLVPPPGSAPSHEISPSPMAQDPGVSKAWKVWIISASVDSEFTTRLPNLLTRSILASTWGSVTATSEYFANSFASEPKVGSFSSVFRSAGDKARVWVISSLITDAAALMRLAAARELFNPAEMTVASNDG